MTTDTTSTPITAEGLRGLGFNSQEAYAWMRVPNAFELEVAVHMRGGWKVVYAGGLMGTAPDLETVARLIDVLRAMNGGDTCSI